MCLKQKQTQAQSRAAASSCAAKICGPLLCDITKPTCTALRATLTVSTSPLAVPANNHAPSALKHKQLTWRRTLPVVILSWWIWHHSTQTPVVSDTATCIVTKVQASGEQSIHGTAMMACSRWLHASTWPSTLPHHGAVGVDTPQIDVHVCCCRQGVAGPSAPRAPGNGTRALQ